MNRQKAMQLLIDELIEFVGEIDVSDPEWTQILFNKRVSSLIRKGVVRTRKLPRKIRLADIIELVVDREVHHGDILADAEQFDDVIRSYGEEPDRESMEEARDSLEKLIESLKEARAAQ
jgi:hypothetical protein